MSAYRDVYVLGNLSESVSCRHPRRLPYRQPRFCGVSLTSPSSRRIVLSFLCEFFRAVLFSMPLLWLLSPNNVVLFWDVVRNVPGALYWFISDIQQVCLKFDFDLLDAY